MTKQLLLYAPVIHRGVEQFIEAELPADEILVVGSSFGEIFKEIRKEIRAVDPARLADDLRSRYHAPNIRVVELAEWPGAVWADEVIAARDVITAALAEYLPAGKASFRPIFLRWDREWAQQGRPAEWMGKVTQEEFVQTAIAAAINAAEGSSDWWRQVGAVVLTPDGAILKGFNRHLPTEQAPYIDGDPRNSFSRGVSIDLSTAIHDAADIVARAARHGIRLDGSEWYGTTFPCPPCAKLIAGSGASRLYFAGGYSMLDGERILGEAGIELIWVDMNRPPS